MSAEDTPPPPPPPTSVKAPSMKPAPAEPAVASAEAAQAKSPNLSVEDITTIAAREGVKEALRLLEQRDADDESKRRRGEKALQRENVELRAKLAALQTDKDRRELQLRRERDAAVRREKAADKGKATAEAKVNEAEAKVKEAENNVNTLVETNTRLRRELDAARAVPLRVTICKAPRRT